MIAGRQAWGTRRTSCVVLTVGLAMSGCGVVHLNNAVRPLSNSEAGRERVKLTDIKRAPLTTTVLVSNPAARELVPVFATRSNEASVYAADQLAPGDHPPVVFRRAVAQLRSRGLRVTSVQCGHGFKSVSGSAALPSSWTGTKVWVAAVNFEVSQVPGSGVGTVHDPYVQLSVSVPFGPAGLAESLDGLDRPRLPLTCPK
jgi:hypothetical protein